MKFFEQCLIFKKIFVYLTVKFSVRVPVNTTSKYLISMHENVDKNKSL